MMFMDMRKEFRFNKEYSKKIKAAVDKHPLIYFNESHFIRISIIKELNRLETEQKVIL